MSCVTCRTLLWVGDVPVVRGEAAVVLGGTVILEVDTAHSLGELLMEEV